METPYGNLTKHGMYAGPNHPDYGEKAGPLWPGHSATRRELKTIGKLNRMRGKEYASQRYVR